MALAVVGTPQAVGSSIGGSADPAGFSVTIETGSNTAVLQWAQWPSGATGAGTMSSATINGVSYDEISQIGEGAGDESATGVLVWFSPATGTQTLDVAWANAPSEGPVATLTCVSDADTGGTADIDINQSSGTASLTLTTTPDDLVLKFDQQFNATPGTTSLWTSLQTDVNLSENARLSSIVASGTSTVCGTEGSSYTTIAAVAFSLGGGGGGGAPGPRVRSLMLTGVGY